MHVLRPNPARRLVDHQATSHHVLDIDKVVAIGTNECGRLKRDRTFEHNAVVPAVAIDDQRRCKIVRINRQAILAFPAAENHFTARR